MNKQQAKVEAYLKKFRAEKEKKEEIKPLVWQFDEKTNTAYKTTNEPKQLSIL